MLNRTFSIKKDRELSSVEARIGSLLTDPLGRRGSGKALPTTLRLSNARTVCLQVKLCHEK